uniref:Uncharacterized protein n=1 Tax=Cucumis melo TaxID=3656 RepID=A0A9I9EMZ3_CUCME
MLNSYPTMPFPALLWSLPSAASYPQVEILGFWVLRIWFSSFEVVLFEDEEKVVAIVVWRSAYDISNMRSIGENDVIGWELGQFLPTLLVELQTTPKSMEWNSVMSQDTRSHTASLQSRIADVVVKAQTGCLARLIEKFGRGNEAIGPLSIVMLLSKLARCGILSIHLNEITHSIDLV